MSAALDSIFAKHNKEVMLCISIHWNDDRSGGFDFFKRKKIATYSSIETQQICIEKGLPFAVFTFSQDTTFSFGDKKMQTFFPGAGHTIDNQVLLFKKEKIIYGGCFIKSTESKSIGFIGDADVDPWPKWLRRLKRKMHRPKYVVTGHQSWASLRLIRYSRRILKKTKAKKSK